MGTKCEYNNGFQEFSGQAQFISVGNISENLVLNTSTTETVLASETIYANTLNKTTQQFRVTITGLLSSDGTDDVALTLRYGSTDILALTTVSLPDEDDKAFRLVFEGRVHTTGATGKIVATGKLETDMTGIADLYGSTAIGGATVDLTADGSLNVSAQWDGSAATSEVAVHTAIIEFFN